MTLRVSSLLLALLLAACAQQPDRVESTRDGSRSTATPLFEDSVEAGSGTDEGDFEDGDERAPKAGAQAAAPSTRLGPPVAPKKPYVVRSSAGDRDDPYYWLRDDKRENPEMLAHLKAE